MSLALHPKNIQFWYNYENQNYTQELDISKSVVIP